jgi:hypothetical protein
MARSSKVAEGKITNHSPTRLNIDIHIELWPIERLIPRDKNPRTHSREQVAQIAASIQKFGWTNPVLVDGDDGKRPGITLCVNRPNEPLRKLPYPLAAVQLCGRS